MTPADALLVVAGVTRSFVSPVETVWAVRDASLTADAGQLVLISGSSGSGKSTLLNLMAGLDDPDAGEITIAGLNVGDLDQDGRATLRRTTVGVVFQEHQLIEEFTAAENVALVLEATGVPPAEARERAEFELSRVGLDGLADRLPAQLSGGQRQRVGVARALIGDRRVILADEPTGALDSRTSGELFSLLRRLCDDGLLVVVCSHDPGARDHADAWYEMRDGHPELESAAAAR